MKNKFKLIACSLFLSVGTLTALIAVEKEGVTDLLNLTSVKAGNEYTLTLDSSNKYVDGNQNVPTDSNNGAFVRFAYTNATQSSEGHVVLLNGGTLKNTEQLTSLSYFAPSFTLSDGASLKFRASNNGVDWGDYACIKPYNNEITSGLFNVPYMHYIEFKAEGGSVDIDSVVYGYTCLESDNQGFDNYEIGTSYVDSNLSYTTSNSYNDLSSGLTVYKEFNGGAKEVLDSNSYTVSVKNSSGVEINKSLSLTEGEHAVTIARKDKAFADISYNFTVVADRFTVTTDLTTPKEIHTDRQKEYLSYDGDYKSMKSSDMPDGKSHLSDSLPVNLAWNFSPTSGKTVSKYSVIYGQKADLSDGYEFIGTTSKSLDLYNPFLGTNYFRICAKYTDNSVEYSSIKTFVVDDTCPRNLTIAGMTNCRDMGGRTTIFGGKIKQGLLYRTSGKGQNGTWDSSAIAKVKEVMVNQLGLKNEIYIADTNNYEVGPSIGLNTYYAYMDYNKHQSTNSRSHFSRNTESVKNVFKILSDENNYPIFYHCKIGTDRTGLVAILVNGILGVPSNMIFQDYLFSNFGNIGSQRIVGNGDIDDIANYMSEIDAMPGNNWQEKTYNTLLAIGVPRSTLDTVINLLTDGPKPNNEQGQIGLNVNQMVVTGNEVTYTPRSSITDRKEPEYYLKLSSNTSASFTFNTSESGTAKIYGYLGHNERTTSKYVNTSVSVSIDNVNVTIPTLNFETANMGYCDGNRTNYYFVPLGEVNNLSAGEHTIKISGVANDMKLGRLSIFGVPATVDENQGNFIPPHIHDFGEETSMPASNGAVAYNYSECECGKKRISFRALDGTYASGSTLKSGTAEGFMKLNKDGNSISYIFNMNGAGTANVSIEGAMDGFSSNGNATMFSGDTAIFEFKMNNNIIDISNYKNVTYSSLFPTTNPVADGYSGVGIVDLGNFDYVNGNNSFVIKRVKTLNFAIRNIIITF
ncbi:MAG: tyrosine-protein phosphatase [Bacilli bacterium]|nr:tyrosine-protein phosphatase [Bacilli bacterium]